MDIVGSREPLEKYEDFMWAILKRKALRNFLKIYKG